MGAGAISISGGIGGWGITVHYSAYLWHCGCGYGVWVGLVCGLGTALLWSHHGSVGFVLFSVGLLCTGLFARTAPWVCRSVIIRPVPLDALPEVCGGCGPVTPDVSYLLVAVTVKSENFNSVRTAFSVSFESLRILR